ncbi:DUF4352 domain-containing protein [Bacillus paranthracis]|uniref:DUF4352 domain-containing protein n=1 Tax=Bacillus paranthracis TaxID=2026186 RepID=UPI00187A5097|nr:DUF4352 domain-containing protein [Bacillus paranthracis]MBE7117301.1 DUF4352 domain-containing protein [Bacillus paranthracis]MBE7134915.1 DUF4352 domain-containing protein [Bacillus paranthracis]MBE7156324.1 DUF4352 domain-containing protein [Bacillus paranthracis]
MKKFLYGIIAAIVLVVIIGACSDSSVEKVEKVDGGKTTETKKEEKQADKVYNVGDTVKIAGVEYTIASAEYITTNEYSQPENGKVLKIHVKAINNGDNQTMVYSGNFNLYNTDGSQQKEFFGAGSPISGDVNKGKSIEGDIFFDVAEAPQYELILKPNPYDKTEAKFNIKL